MASFDDQHFTDIFITSGLNLIEIGSTGNQLALVVATHPVHVVSAGFPLFVTFATFLAEPSTALASQSN